MLRAHCIQKNLRREGCSWFPFRQWYHLSLELAAYLPWPSERSMLVCSGHSTLLGSGSHLHTRVPSQASGGPDARGGERLGILSTQKSSRNTCLV